MKTMKMCVLAASLAFPYAVAAQSVPVISAQDYKRCDGYGTYMRDMMIYRFEGGDRAAVEAGVSNDPAALLIINDAYTIDAVDLAGNPYALEVGLRMGEFNTFMTCINQLAQ